MKRLLSALMAIMWLSGSGDVLASSRSSSHSSRGSSTKSSKSSSSGKKVHVKAYKKKNGTHVAAHDRSAPKPKGKGTTPTASTPDSTKQ